MKKEDIIKKLSHYYNEEKTELQKMSKEELKELLNEYEDRYDSFPNNDENDGSHSWD